jgi:nucleoside-triphosphatase
MMAQQMSKAYLLTGKPRVGKTTAIKKIIDALGVERCGGFYTEEVHVQERRVGFRLITLDGRHGLLAHVNSESRIRVGRYGVNLDCLESIGLAALYEAMATKDLIIFDEIGPMEMYSEQFKRTIMELLNSSRPLLGTIALKSNLWLDAIKQHKRVELYTLTLDNRNSVVDKLIRRLNSVRQGSILKKSP